MKIYYHEPFNEYFIDSVCPKEIQRIKTWLVENDPQPESFCFVGILGNRIYFENKELEMTFKLRWL